MFKLIICFLALLFCGYNSCFGQVLINEVQSRNSYTLTDFEGDSPDWIELYNSDSETVNLQNWFLSDNASDLYKWKFDAVEIPAEGYLVIFASGKDLQFDELHSNFKLDGDGEKLFLSSSAGLLQDELDTPALGLNESYGRIDDGEENWQHFFVPTAGISNELGTVLVKPHFNLEGVFQPDSAWLNIVLEESLEDNFKVHFTLDASLPNPDSEMWEEGIWLTDRTEDPTTISRIPTSHGSIDGSVQAWTYPEDPVLKSWVIRAAVFDESGRQCSKVITRNYLPGWLDNPLSQKDVIFVNAEKNDWFGYNEGIYVPGIHFGSDPMNWDWTGNYFQRGGDWEVAANFEFAKRSSIDSGLNEDVGIRVHGNRTRCNAQKSLKVYARDEYGKSRIENVFFENNGIEELKHFIIRTPFSSWNLSLISDPLSHAIVETGLDLETQAFKPVLVFLNGEFWGLQYLRERQNEFYLQEHFGGDKEDYDVLEPWGENVSGNGAPDFIAFREFVENSDLSLNQNYLEVLNYIDIDHYVDYQIAQNFFGNKDWPGNNELLWRDREGGGKFRWFFFDIDAGYSDPNIDMFERVSREIHGWFGVLFNKLKENEEFKSKFVARYQQLLETNFHPSNTRPLLDEYKSIVAPDVELLLDRWELLDGYIEWSSRVKELEYFLSERPCAIRNQLIEEFDLVETDFSNSICNKEDQLHIYPNPTKGELKIEFFTEMQGLADIKLFNSSGQLMQAFSLELEQGNQELLMEIDRSLNSGMYCFKIKMPNKVYVGQVVFVN